MVWLVVWLFPFAVRDIITLIKEQGMLYSSQFSPPSVRGKKKILRYKLKEAAVLLNYCFINSKSILFAYLLMPSLTHRYLYFILWAFQLLDSYTKIFCLI